MDRPSSVHASNNATTFVPAQVGGSSELTGRQEQARKSLIRSHAAKASSKKKGSRNLSVGRRLFDEPQVTTPVRYVQRPDSRAQWRVVLNKSPPSQGLHVINPFGPSNAHFDQTTHQLLQFFEAQTPNAKEVLPIALQHQVCMLALTAYSAATMRRVQDTTLSANFELRLASAAYASMRSHLSSPEVELEGIVHALAFFCITSVFQPDVMQTRAHLKALSDVLRTRSIESLPSFLQDVISFCDIETAAPFLWSTFFEPDDHDFNCDIETTFDNYADAIDREISAAGLSKMDARHTADLVRCAELTLTIFKDIEDGLHLPQINRYHMHVLCRRLSIFNDGEDTALRRRLSLVIVLCMFAFCTPMSGFGNCPPISDETIASFRDEATQANLRSWNDNIDLMMAGLPYEVNQFVSHFTAFIKSELQHDFPSLAEFVHEYFRAVDQQFDSFERNSISRETARVAFCQKVFAGVLPAWPAVVAAHVSRLRRVLATRTARYDRSILRISPEDLNG